MNSSTQLPIELSFEVVGYYLYIRDSRSFKSDDGSLFQRASVDEVDVSRYTGMEVNPMASVTVEAVYQDGILKPLQALDLPDNVHVWIQIIPTHGEEAMAEENHFKLRLVELGLLREIRTPSDVPEGDRTPIQVKGKSLSQTIIEERR
jgi:predicted DNA-binding antitoxin AbrB/MazE fold protein